LNTVSSQTHKRRKYELKARAEAQERTRERIAAAAAELHEEVGVAKTTVADIARRAGVQRLTVYNHFPDLEALLPACTAHYMSLHPLPDLEAAFALEDPRDRARAVLSALYGWYRDNEAIQERVQGDRATVPELDDFMAGTFDVALADFAARLGDSEPARALARLALDFWTWRRLSADGLDDDAAADLMAGAVACAAS
jgi:AcrR family transcriptional regulator